MGSPGWGSGVSLFRPDMTPRGDGQRALFLPLLAVAGLWLLRWAELRFELQLPVWGIIPGDFRGPEFLLAPLIHGNAEHLFSNSVPLLALGAAVLYLYPAAAVKIFPLLYLGTSALVWLFAGGGPHIGASGINYGLVCFIFFSGVIRREPPAIALALLVTFLYGSMVWGVLPGDPNISWESHLAGSILGTAYAVVYRLTNPPVLPPMPGDDDPDNAPLDPGARASRPNPFLDGEGFDWEDDEY